ncbi:MAG TPA: hypothetical protein VF660_03765 [Actinomycetota bacterium]
MTEPVSRTETRVVFGAVTKEAAQVVLDVDQGQDVRGRLLALPTFFDAPFYAFVAVPPRHTDGRVRVVDADGRLIASQPLGPDVPPPGSEPGKPVPVADSQGRLVGFWPYRFVFGPPGVSGEGATGPPGGRATPDEIRNFALSPLRPTKRTRGWWVSRPDPSAADQDFIDWWRAYSSARTSPTKLPTPLVAPAVSGHVWGVYVAVASRGSRSLSLAVARLRALGIARFRINTGATISCDIGAAEALHVSMGNEVVAVYFSLRSDAYRFADHLDPPPVGVARVEIACND